MYIKLNYALHDHLFFKHCPVTIIKEALEIFYIDEYVKLHNFLCYEMLTRKNVQLGVPSILEFIMN